MFRWDCVSLELMEVSMKVYGAVHARIPDELDQPGLRPRLVAPESLLFATTGSFLSMEKPLV